MYLHKKFGRMFGFLSVDGFDSHCRQHLLLLALLVLLTVDVAMAATCVAISTVDAISTVELLLVVSV